MKPFSSNEIEKQRAEAREKWGNTNAYKEHEEKTKDYSQQKWNDLSDGMDQIMAEFALCLKNGDAPNCPKAQGLVQALQGYITENYYQCTNEILAGLGQMYVGDERFKNNIDKHGDGTASFISNAIKIYCHK